MKAVVLSYDKNHYLVDNMIAAYNRVWPSHPFVFRVPYQKNKSYLQDKYGSQVEMVESPHEIVKTILHLVSDLPPEEWVYWCIDDKYPINLNEAVANNYFNWVQNQDYQKCRGLVFHRAWALWSYNVDQNVTLNTEFSTQLLRRRSWRNFWLHQFYRVSVIQSVIGTFEREPKMPIQMDNWVKFDIPEDYNLWVAKKSIALYGESSSGGNLLKNTYKSLLRNDISIPEDVKRLNKSVYLGTKLAHLHMKTHNYAAKVKKKIFGAK